MATRSLLKDKSAIISWLLLELTVDIQDTALQGAETA
jgi:hypothetical protein